MKIITTLFAFALAFTLAAQVPNASFESWSNGNPNGWTTNCSPPSVVTLTQSNQAHTGSSAINLSATMVSTTSIGAVMYTGYHTSTVTAGDNLTCWYKSNFQSGDALLFNVLLFSNGNAVSGGVQLLSANAATYTQYSVATSPYNGTIDSVYIQMQILDTITGQPSTSTYAIIDDLHLGGVTGISSQDQALRCDVFPNPSAALLNVSSAEAGTVRLFASDGRLLYTETIAAATALQIDLSPYPEGLLLLEFSNEKHSFSQGVVHTR